MKKIVFTGGGSGGHVMPALTIIKNLQERYAQQLEISYIGGAGYIESALVPQHGIAFRAIKTGKLRRYFSWQNFLDIFRLSVGVMQSLLYLLKLKRKSDLIVFSTGGFVTVPVCIAAWILRIPIFIHEQTTQVGLANKITSLLARKVFISFENSRKFFPKHKTFYSGYPIRPDFFAPASLSLSFPEERPLLFVTGGGNGAQILNEKVKSELNELKERFNIVHQVGGLFLKEFASLEDDSYRVYDFITDDLVALFQKADIIISRAGAGTVCELLSISKRSIFVPLKIAQKNEQYFNALEAKEKMGSMVIKEDDFKNSSLIKVCEDFQSTRCETDNKKESDALVILRQEITQILKI